MTERKKKENLFPLNVHEVKRKLFLKILGGDQGLKPASKTLERFLMITKSRIFNSDTLIMMVSFCSENHGG